LRARRSTRARVFPGKAKADSATANRHVALGEGGDAVGAARGEVPLGADPGTSAGDERDRDGAGHTPLVQPERELTVERPAEVGQQLPEPHQPVVLLALARR